MRRIGFSSFVHGLCAAPAWAQVVGPDGARGHRIAAMASGFRANINTVARADGNGGRLGTRLDLENISERLWKLDYQGPWLGTVISFGAPR